MHPNTFIHYILDRYCVYIITSIVLYSKTHTCLFFPHHNQFKKNNKQKHTEDVMDFKNAPKKAWCHFFPPRWDTRPPKSCKKSCGRTAGPKRPVRYLRFDGEDSGFVGTLGRGFGRGRMGHFWLFFLPGTLNNHILIVVSVGWWTKSLHNLVVATQIFWIFYLYLGFHDPIWRAYFSTGLKPPTGHFWLFFGDKPPMAKTGFKLLGISIYLVRKIKFFNFYFMDRNGWASRWLH